MEEKVKSKQEPNMVKYFDRLTVKERAILCGLLARFDSPEAGNNISIGVLPFVKLSSVLQVVAKARSVSQDRERIYKQILSKLESLIPSDRNFVRFTAYLDDKKVHRWFGRHPERGSTLPWLAKEKVTVGLKNQFGRVSPDKDVLVGPTVAMKRITEGMWEVTTLARCQHDVENWLVESCR